MSRKLREKLGGPRFAAAVFLAAACLAGCSREQITVYRVPKEKEPAGAELQAGAAAQPQIQWKTPQGWEEQPAGGMSVANFLIPADAGRKAQLSVMTFPGEGAGELSLVNIVRENAGLAPVSDEELAKLVEKVNVGPTPAKLVDLTGATGSSSNAPPNRILVAVCPHGGTTWFFKLAGDAGVVSAQKPTFVEFLKSVSFAESGGAGGLGPHFVSTNAKKIPSEAAIDGGAAEGAQGKPSWEVPAGWQEVPPSQMLLAKFLVGGAEGKAEITVSAFPGDTGGVLANVNRWRGQVGLAPLGQAEVDRHVSALDVIGGKAMLVDVTGESRTAGKARLIGVIVPRERQTWFYKMLGDPTVAERQKDAFIKFVQSVRYPNV